MSGQRRRFVWEIDWNLLRTFMVIVQERGLTAAGERLSLTQPSVSNALRRLETHMGCRLIERKAAHFSVTPAGQRLYGECVSLFDIVSGLPTRLEEGPDEISGHIEIALASHVVCPFFDDVLAAFHQTFLGVTLSLTVAPSREIIDAVLGREASLGICLLPERNARLETQPLYREHFGYFCGQRHPLFGRAGVRIEDLKDEPYVSFKTDQMSDALWPVALLRQQHGLAGKVMGTSSHLEEVKRLIVAGFGFGPMPIHAVEEDVKAGRLWRLPPFVDPPAVDVHLVYDPVARRSRPETLLLDTLLKALADTPLAERTYPRTTGT